MAGTIDPFLEDLFQPVPDVRFKRMFGGVGIFRDELMFGLVADDVLHLKADEQTIAAFEAEGCGPFVYEGKGRMTTMPYWRVPERLFDEPEEFAQWAEAAFAVALRVAKAKKPSRKKAVAVKK